MVASGSWSFQVGNESEKTRAAVSVPARYGYFLFNACGARGYKNTITSIFTATCYEGSTVCLELCATKTIGLGVAGAGDNRIEAVSCGDLPGKT
jgi:hypothetical protein